MIIDFVGRRRPERVAGILVGVVWTLSSSRVLKHKWQADAVSMSAGETDRENEMVAISLLGEDEKTPPQNDCTIVLYPLTVTRYFLGITHGCCCKSVTGAVSHPKKLKGCEHHAEDFGAIVTSFKEVLEAKSFLVDICEEERRTRAR